MELKSLKPKLGRWLTIEELKGLLAAMPDELCHGIPINRKLLEIASQFVEERGGWWEHPDWESYLNRLSQEGFELSQDANEAIGNILEIFKDYYREDNYQVITDKRRKPANREAGQSGKKAKAAKAAAAAE